MSLKDRIKQFEQPGAQSAAPPPLRPKPGTLGQWKPKPVEPSSPKQAPANVDAHEGDEGAGGAMSASDAANSIARTGQSLKERMAALQGRGAFGSSETGNAPPLPSHEGKPRVWKTSPAPPIEPKKLDTSLGVENARNDPSAPSSALEAPLSAAATEQSSEGGQSGNPDEEGEESERERRAALAARMARLGGARVGMPIGFGVAAKGLPGHAKPNVPKIATPDQEKDEDILSPQSDPAAEEEGGSATQGKKSTLDMALKIPLPKSQGSLLSPAAGESSGMLIHSLGTKDFSPSMKLIINCSNRFCLRL